jgi:hypothetical protein
MMRRLLPFLIAAFVTVVATPASADPPARVVLLNFDAGSGVGLDDPTPVAPVAGNKGTTLGQQRQIALAHAASIWARNLRSFVPIRIAVAFRTRTCTATGAVLASAGPAVFLRDFGKWTTQPGHWYPIALANKLGREDFVPTPVGTIPEYDISAIFNINLGNADCLAGVPFYYGLDGNEGARIDLVATALHEFGHGFGVTQTVNINPTINNPPQPNPNFGALLGGFPDVYNRNLYDNTIGKTWPAMTVAERQQSIPNGRNVVWTGAHVTAVVPSRLALGLPVLSISAPAAIDGQYDVGAAAFGAALSSPGISEDIVVATDAADAFGPSTTDACSAITNVFAIAGRIALVDRGTCGFVVKVKNLQNAGAVAAIIADNAPDSPPAGLGGADPTITIPAARILRDTGSAIKARLSAGDIVTGTLGLDMTRRAGADINGRAQVNATNPIVPGSSIAHWDPVASPNLLMEPAINADLNHSLDLTLPLLHDIGWLDEEVRDE